MTSDTDPKRDSSQHHTRPALDRNAPDNTVQTAMALGCFWSPDARFGSVEGVVRTCVGYAGGTSASPTYDTLDDHIETVRIEYDPKQLTYADLLDLFWAAHNPTRAPFKRQYQSTLFPSSPDQEQKARASAAAKSKELDDRLTTEIIEDAAFYRAEAYHQKHSLRQHPSLLKAVQSLYPNEKSFMDAPSTALINGYLGGYRSPAHLNEDCLRLGLRPEMERALRTIVNRRHE